ncbi:integrase arm-type DNA-binding domain-containing protein [Mesorhizobium sp.]|uniref:tyrosine-type recombinase/integrase n=1 Tax=Mesorhizobium sp. TaxID=1871066 RepID=UPI00257BE3EF|nr:integrase arm-type DNA-binding domain-containing protein [Mesorhizobium sp.]
MARASNKLTDTWLKRAKIGNGIHGDGDGLYLRVQGDNRSWVYIYSHEGKRREMGIGAYPNVGLADARGRADEARQVRTGGGDPIVARDAARVAEQASKAAVRLAADTDAANTFAKVAGQFIAAKERGWTHDITTKYKGYVRNHLATFGQVPCGDITTGAICDAIKDVWDTPTGPYVRSFIERVLDFAMVKGVCPERLNPARIIAVRHVLHDRSHETKHHEAMPYQDVPAFVQGLGDTVAAHALAFCILTATRQRETREATWREFDADLTLWTIPKARYKTRLDHRIPISEAARALLIDLKSNRDPDSLVFPGERKGRPLSQHRFQTLIPAGYKPHGFRTSFVGWATKVGKFSDDMAQRCLGHLIGTEVSRSYDRDDRLDERRVVHDAWAAYLFAANT